VRLAVDLVLVAAVVAVIAWLLIPVMPSIGP
jgi:hypothetical protein